MTVRVFSIAVAVIMIGSFVRAQNPGRGGDAGRGARGGGLANKVPELPAGTFTASPTVARTMLQQADEEARQIV